MKTKAELIADNKELLAENLKLWSRIETLEGDLDYRDRFIRKLRIEFRETLEKLNIRGTAQIIADMFERQMETLPEMHKQWRSDRGRTAVNKRHAKGKEDWKIIEAKKMFKEYREAEPEASDWIIYKRMCVKLGLRPSQWRMIRTMVEK